MIEIHMQNYGNILKDIKVKLKDSRTLPKGAAFQRMYRVDQSSNILHAELVIFLKPKSCYAAFLLYSSARVAITKYHRTGDLTEFYFLAVLEAGSLRSGCLQSWFLMKPHFQASAIDGHFLSVSPHSSRSSSVSSSTQKDISPIILGAHHYDLV